MTEQFWHDVQKKTPNHPDLSRGEVGPGDGQKREENVEQPEDLRGLHNVVPTYALPDNFYWAGGGGGGGRDHTWRATVHGNHYVTGIFQGLGLTGVLCK